MNKQGLHTCNCVAKHYSLYLISIFLRHRFFEWTAKQIASVSRYIYNKDDKKNLYTKKKRRPDLLQVDRSHDQEIVACINTKVTWVWLISESWQEGVFVWKKKANGNAWILGFSSSFGRFLLRVVGAATSFNYASIIIPACHFRMKKKRRKREKETRNCVS